MDLTNAIAPLAGGGIIGVAVTLMLLFNGRVAGISGILSGLLNSPKADSFWRLAFLAGLLVGGVVLRILDPAFFQNTSGRGLGLIALAGLLVGFGTVMGGGCTSGHGVCGVSRFSLRSVLATGTFILFGFVSVYVAKLLLGGTQ